MLSVSSLIEFLLDLLRDDEAAAEFARDPQGVLERNGLQGVTAQDVCDAGPILADHAGVTYHGGGGHGGGHHYRPQHDDPVREIHHVVQKHTVDRDVVIKNHNEHNTYNEYNNEFNYTDNSIHAENVIQDSFNEDNDGVDNKGGVINDSNVAGRDQTDVGNTDEDTTVTDSFNEDNSETTTVSDSLNDSSDNSTNVTDSLNDSSTQTAVEVNGSYNTDNSANVGGDVDNDGIDADITGAA